MTIKLHYSSLLSDSSGNQVIPALNFAPVAILVIAFATFLVPIKLRKEMQKIKRLTMPCVVRVFSVANLLQCKI